MHARRVDQHVAVPVVDERIFVPALLPELVADVHVLLGAIVTFVVLEELAEAVLRRGAQVGRDDVPTHAPVREMVERGEQLRGQERLVVGGDEADVPGLVREQRQEQGRVVAGQLALREGVDGDAARHEEAPRSSKPLVRCVAMLLMERRSAAASSSERRRAA